MFLTLVGKGLYSCHERKFLLISRERYIFMNRKQRSLWLLILVVVQWQTAEMQLKLKRLLVDEPAR